MHCKCSDHELKRRLKARGTSQDLAKLKNWPAFLSREVPDVAIPFDHLTINTETDISKKISRTLEYVVERAGVFTKRGASQS